MYASSRFLTSKFFVWLALFLIGFPSVLWYHVTMNTFPVSYQGPRTLWKPQFTAHGNSRCLPETLPQFHEEAAAKRVVCRKYSPFTTGRARVATVTAQFGEPKEHYQRALRTHVLHALVHGTEVRVMCDAMVDDLWNKPAFILDLLMQEMLKAEKDRLEWIQWVDRDTLILDQCRPITSFLPPSDESSLGSWWRRRRRSSSDDVKQLQKNETHMLVTQDWNGLNNGIFLVRVNAWAIDLFTAILAFRHYRPDVDLPFTEQSAMEHVLGTDEFKDQARYVPQHWFNGYEQGGANLFDTRQNVAGLEELYVRRGDYLVHFAGRDGRSELLKEWSDMLERQGDVWQEGRVQRDVRAEVKTFWRGLGHRQ